MKVAQFLSTVPDALPAEYADELAQLQANAPPMGWNFVRRRMASRARCRTGESQFRRLRTRPPPPQPAGQVHRARLEGRHRSRLQASVPGHAEHGGSRPAPAPRGDGDLSPHGQRHPARRNLQGASERLREELDYRREAAHMRLYGYDAGEQSTVMCLARSSASAPAGLLTMTWLEGRPLHGSAGTRTRRRRSAIASRRRCFAPGTCRSTATGSSTGTRTWATIRRGPTARSICSIWCYPRVRREFVRGVIDLYEAVRDNDDDKAHHAYETWGFTHLSREKMEVLNVGAVPL